MNVASLSLSKRLYELSGWNDTDNSYLRGTLPAYELGFILRKLPNCDIYKRGKEYQCWYNVSKTSWISPKADTPEDCVALLAITLFEQGILEREK